MEYYRITAYHTDEDISVILDSNGRFESLWDFSSFLVSHGFKVLSLSRAEVLVESTFPLIEETNKLAVREIEKGMPTILEFEYNARKCRGITVGDKLYGQYLN